MTYLFFVIFIRPTTCASVSSAMRGLIEYDIKAVTLRLLWFNVA